MGLTVFGLFVLPQRKSWPDLILQKKKSPGPLAASPALLNFFRFSSVVSTVVSQKKKKKVVSTGRPSPKAIPSLCHQ